MKQRCNKCGNRLLELWNEGKTIVWIACSHCDRDELNEMKRRKMEDDVDKVRVANRRNNE